MSLSLSHFQFPFNSLYLSLSPPARELNASNSMSLSLPLSSGAVAQELAPELARELARELA